MATHVRKELPNENGAPGPKAILKKASNKLRPETSNVGAAKVFREPNVVAVARGALVELGNKPPTKAEPIAKIADTTNGTLKTTLPVVRKKTNASKENVVKPVQRLPIKQVVLKRQESTLAKLVKPLSNINVREDSGTVATGNVESDKTELAAATSYSSKQLVDVIDVDASAENDPHSVSTYVKDIMRYLLELEKRYTITANYLLDKRNHNTTPKIRSVLVNWMVQVHGSFRFLSETLHLSVAITDRYLQKMPEVGQKTLQLVGTTALFIAGKYEEVYTPEISEFVFMCDDTFSKVQMLQMERDILARINFELGGPLSLHFLRRYNKIAEVDIEHHALGKYLIELALMDHRVSHVYPSLQAAAACFLALATLGTSSRGGGVNRGRTNSLPACISQYWTKTLTHYSTYSFNTIVPHVHNLAYLLIEATASKYQAVRSKYAGNDHKKISMHVALQSPVVKRFANLAKI